MKLLWGSEIETDHLILARRPNLVVVNNKKRTFRIMDFAVTADHRVKLKESEKIDKIGLARELEKSWNMKGTVIPIVNGALSTVAK